ncbi:MAG: hypothetical protein BMS9Abin12_0532 [Acidimicrobiia bacterium]|nr:MAG: hypothetical protein BMS9Abin12_0532 [Acidimicrobiia bacterium]
MDATTRWETEAIRSVGGTRQSPPKPTRKRTRSDFTDNRHWVTLREAEEATGIPTNTLRKWVRKADLPSYLEADGDLALRMVDLDAVVARAKELGRSVAAQSRERASENELESPSPLAGEARGVKRRGAEGESESPPGTMIVPIDAWNKMLNQLGNLHEAGQQLATARERAAKAETEVSFLRERLAEMRVETPDSRPRSQEPVANIVEPEPAQPPTTTYWRYVTTGWRDRRKRR